MFENARKLVLRDRDGARKALKAEIEADQESGIEAELDQLAAEAEDAERAADAERRRLADEAERAREIAATREGLSAAAAEFDAAATALGNAFDEIEALQSRLSALEPDARVDVNMRKWGYLRAIWFAAAPLCRRIGLARTMGSSRNAPLVAQYEGRAK